MPGCEDSDQNASHQPERWWYTYVEVDPYAFYVDPFDGQVYSQNQRSAIIMHELGHTLGLGERYNCNVASVMSATCVKQNQALIPKPVDVCGINHPGGANMPLMYGNDPATTLVAC